MSGYLKEDDADKETNKTSNVPIQCQLNGLEFSMKASNSPFLILVYGIRQTAQVVPSLVERLEDGGHDVKVPALPSLGSVPATPRCPCDVLANPAESSPK